PLDVHLMIVNPDQYIQQFADSGADVLTVHYEACPHLHRTVQAIRAAGMKAGVALNPHTNVDLLENVINDIDMVLIMSVNPGFGGQKFIQNACNKVSQVKSLADKHGAEILIEVDGGVNLDTGKQLIDAGADVLVAGSFVFNSDNPSDTVTKLKSL
ncbi:MAG: ribulose-phosphate 3-epimerase, partial [Crocinitomicaceae bacterium]|nr:ribulose-phosphate 3-epimerase [Crocinitomicaceae bacterium]